MWWEVSRVSEISLALAVSAAIGRIARLAIATPAKLARKVPPMIPAAIRSQIRSIVSSTCAVLRPYWT